MITRIFFSAVVASAAATSAAWAGACPAEHVLTEPRDLGAISGKAVKVETWEELKLEDWRGVGALSLRMRHFTIQPGGRVPIHSHGDRPSIIYFVSGEATEHNSFCAVPIVHKAGESVGEFGASIVHWWSNDGDVPAVLVSTDIIPTK